MGANLFPVLLIVILILCCVLPMLFMGRHSKNSDKESGHKRK